MAHYYDEPRKKYSKEAIAKWTENSRNQDRSNHPFIKRNKLLCKSRRDDYEDAVLDAENELAKFKTFKTVDGDKNYAEEIMG